MRLSVILVEYQCFEEIFGAIQSLDQHLNGLDWECLVVSNSEYTPEKIGQIRQKLPDVKLLVNEKNRGYAGGVNKGLSECEAPYIFIMNPDCRVLDAQLENMIRVFEEDRRVAVVGPAVVDDEGIIQPSCRRFPKVWTHALVRGPFRAWKLARREYSRYFMEDLSRSCQLDVDWLSGGAMLVRRSAVEAVGLMDERFFLYMEDVDWCRRFWNAGWKVRYFPMYTVRHSGRHASLRPGLARLRSAHTRYHLVSIAKYFLKHGFSVRR